MAATKKSASPVAQAALDGWYAKTDPHPLVERQKASVRGKPRGSLGPLHGQRTLGVMLLALRRTRDALRVFDEAAAMVKPTGKGDPWWLAACCAAFAHWVREREGGEGGARLSKFAKPAAHAAQVLQPALWTKARFKEEIASHWEELAKATRDNRDLAVDTMAFHLAAIVFLRELHVLAPVHGGKVPADVTDVAIERALGTIEAKIATQLAKTKAAAKKAK